MRRHVDFGWIRARLPGSDTALAERPTPHGAMIVFKPDRFGRGQHGGLRHFEQSFLITTGDRQEAGAPRADAVSIVDLAPTVPHHLQLPGVGMNGSPVQITRQAHTPLYQLLTSGEKNVF
jgi:hypothetical protein